MPELIDNRQVFTLTEVANSIKKTIAERYTSGYWIKAEINKLNVYAKTGHAFPELVYKENNTISCEMRATIWKTDLVRINSNFKSTLKEPLKEGIKVLIFANITYEPKYGLSLVIRDIDPSYSLGELEREKNETIQKLQAENLFGKNKLVPIALLPKRIAIISVDTSKGYQDFIKVIDQNIFGYRFFHMLFPAVLQGDAAVKTITAQLKRIKKVKIHFDVVAIIRGGGAEVGMTSFNHYTLAKAICKFPLPVFTGIGHSTNLTVSEMVAFQSGITPTELGSFLLQRFHDFAVPVQEAAQIILQEPLDIIHSEKKAFNNLTTQFKNATKHLLAEKNHDLKDAITDVNNNTKLRIQSEKLVLNQKKKQIDFATQNFIKQASKNVHEMNLDLVDAVKINFDKLHDKLVQQEKIIKLVDPINVLKRGYSITTINGKLIKKKSEIVKGVIIKTETTFGEFESEITKG